MLEGEEAPAESWPEAESYVCARGCNGCGRGGGARPWRRDPSPRPVECPLGRLDGDLGFGTCLCLTARGRCDYLGRRRPTVFVEGPALHRRPRSLGQSIGRQVGPRTHFSRTAGGLGFLRPDSSRSSSTAGAAVPSRRPKVAAAAVERGGTTSPPDGNDAVESPRRRRNADKADMPGGKALCGGVPRRARRAEGEEPRDLSARTSPTKSGGSGWRTR